MNYHLFCVNNKPYCIWDNDRPNKNSDFIKSISPDYLFFIANLNLNIINALDSSDDEKKYAAITLRIFYSQALETLFALVFSMLQAPSCVHAWMLKYNTNDLMELVRKTDSGKSYLIRFYKLKNINWDSITKLIFHFLSEDKSTNKGEIIDNFSTTIKHFAIDFLDKNRHNEYNSIKHGFRIQSGAVTLKLKPENSNTETGWQNYLYGEYGSTFYISEKISNNEINFKLATSSNNWKPENLHAAIILIGLIISNIKSFLIGHNKIKVEILQYKIPEDNFVYNLPWNELYGTGNITMNFGFDQNALKLITKEEVLESYKPKKSI